jgi:hypothetical protein
LSKIDFSPQSHRGHGEIIFIWRAEGSETFAEEVPPNKKSPLFSKQRSYPVSEPRKASAILFPRGLDHKKSSSVYSVPGYRFFLIWI